MTDYEIRFKNILSYPKGFVLKYRHFTDEQKEIYLRNRESIFDLIRILKNIGVKFEYISRKDLGTFSYQLYNGELFHLLARDRINPFMLDNLHFEITKEMCD